MSQVQFNQTEALMLGEVFRTFLLCDEVEGDAIGLQVPITTTDTVAMIIQGNLGSGDEAAAFSEVFVKVLYARGEYELSFTDSESQLLSGILESFTRIFPMELVSIIFTGLLLKTFVKDQKGGTVFLDKFEVFLGLKNDFDTKGREGFWVDTEYVC